MSLDVYLKAVRETVFEANITHNLGCMAREAGIYNVLWRPDEHGIERAEQLIEPLRAGLAKLRAHPEHFRQFDAANGWGAYVDFVPWLERYLAACEANPDAKVEVWR